MNQRQKLFRLRWSAVEKLGREGELWAVLGCSSGLTVALICWYWNFKSQNLDWIDRQTDMEVSIDVRWEVNTEGLELYELVIVEALPCLAVVCCS